MNATIGDLCGHDLHKSYVSLEYGDSTISGLLTELHYGCTNHTLSGPIIEVTVRVGGVTVERLPRNTPCLISRPSGA